MVSFRQQLGSESGEFRASAFDPEADESWDTVTPLEITSRSGDSLDHTRASRDVLVDESRFVVVSGDSTDLERLSTEATVKCCSINELSNSDVLGRLKRFQILEILGKGHQAIVYRALDPLLQRQVALKLLRRGTPRGGRPLERFLGEARALAQLTHPGIVPVYEAGCEGNCHYIVMALIEGRSLAELIGDRTLSFFRAAEIVAELADALAYAHGLGIVHRDVKPANIRLDQQGAVYLMDFGIAYCPDSDEIPCPPGTILGTPAYLAPEQATGEQPSAIPASDQYSLGAVLYELLCGRPAFSGPCSATIFQVIHQKPPPARSIEPKVPRPLEAICEKAMAKQPERRYSTCQELADELRRWIRGESSLISRSSWLRRRLRIVWEKRPQLHQGGQVEPCRETP